MQDLSVSQPSSAPRTGAELVDIIIPSRDYGRFLGTAIRSALAQVGADVLVTVVDDGSTDDTQDVTAHFGVNTLHNAQPQGLGAARNRGLAATSRPYLAFLDADDHLPPGRTTQLLDALTQSPDAGYAFGVSRTFQDPNSPGSGPTTLIEGPAPGTVLFRRTCFAQVGPFDESVVHLNMAEWLLKARRMGIEGVSIDSVVLDRRLHSSNMSLQDAKRLAALSMARRHLAAGGEPKP
jgi:glycosyltransferase involved in cell wall biosynthesis